MWTLLLFISVAKLGGCQQSRYPLAVESYAQVAATSKNELYVLKMDLSFNPFTASCRGLALLGVL